MASTANVDVGQYLAHQRDIGLLRFLTCGSVDDGKSTLIGRLLYESKMIFSDHLLALESDSRRFGTQGAELDFALLVDGLAAEREQGITIDVAYRFFATEKRRFIVADTPGHAQYTRNMVTGASTADLAVILVDARSGLLTQTRRHSYLVALLGIPRVVLAVNKLDLVGYDEQVFTSIAAEYREFAAHIGLGSSIAAGDAITCIPVSALRGDNLLEPSLNTPWYGGPSLLEHLENVPAAASTGAAGGFRLPVQWVNRPSPDFRGYSGTVVGGVVRPGDSVTVLPAGGTSRIARIVTADHDLPEAVVDRAVTVTLEDNIDVSRGDMIVGAEAPAHVARQFQAHLVWMDTQPLIAGGRYLLKCGSRTVAATVSAPKYAVNVDTLDHLAAPTLGLNEIGVCVITADTPIAFDPYRDNRDTGGFLIIDRLRNATVAAGMIDHPLRRSSTVQWQPLEVTKGARAERNGHGSAVVWMTGLSGAGKSTLANALEQRLHASGVHTFVLDGDNVRHGLNQDLGFTDADRIENVRRLSEVAALMVDAGLVVIVAAISPFQAQREAARALVGAAEFLEVYVDAPMSVVEDRDRKGLYARARAGEIPHFTGVDSSYQPPVAPEVHVDTSATEPADAVEQIVAALVTAGVVDAP